MGSLYGYEIYCDRPLARLSEASGRLGSIAVRATADRPLEIPAADLGALVLSADGTIPSHARALVGGRILTWHHDAGSFLADPDQRIVSYRAEDRLDPDSPGRWEDRLASTSIPLLLAARGGVALHAAANLVAGKALVICGVTGRGKSSLSAALAAAGHPALGEDGVVIWERDGAPFASPGAPGALIGPEVAAAIGAGGDGRDSGAPAGLAADPRGRRMFRLPCADHEAPVGAVVFLAERGGGEVEVEPVASAKCHRELLNHTLRWRRADPAPFAATARLAAKTRGAIVKVPDSVSALHEATAALAAFATAGSRAGTG